MQARSYSENLLRLHRRYCSVRSNGGHEGVDWSVAGTTKVDDAHGRRGCNRHHACVDDAETLSGTGTLRVVGNALSFDDLGYTCSHATRSRIAAPDRADNEHYSRRKETGLEPGGALDLNL